MNPRWESMIDLDTPVDKNVTESLDRVFWLLLLSCVFNVARLALNEQASARGCVSGAFSFSSMAPWLLDIKLNLCKKGRRQQNQYT